MTNPGQMRQRIELLRDESKDNEFGGRRTLEFSSDESYKPFATAWAKIEPINARETFESNRSVVEITHEITMRYRKDITRETMMKFKGRLFRIGHILNVNEANRFLQISATEET